MRRYRSLSLVAVPVAVSLLALAACSSSKSADTSTGNTTTAGSASAGAADGQGAPGGTIKFGVITDSTGAAASGYTTTETGIKAYVDAVNAAGGVNGKKLSYVMADSTSTPGGALTAAEKLVQSDKVFAVISVTSDMFGAEPYLLKAGIPVVGTGFDGPEWVAPSNTNLFDALGPSPAATVYTTVGIAMKQLGATTCGSVGYIESPSSTESATAEVKSCVTQGLKSGYVASVSFGSTDMAPVALKMKSDGVDGVFMSTVPNTGFSLAAALRQAGVTPKAFILATGYGGDLLSSSASVSAAQGFEFSSTGEPVEMNTPATQTEVKNLAAVGEKNTPTFAEQSAYIDVAALVVGLKAAGSDVTRKSFMTAMRGVTGFDADGLLAPEKINFSSYAPTSTCEWLVKLEGTRFVPLPNIPICGPKVG